MTNIDKTQTNAVSKILSSMSDRKVIDNSNRCPECGEDSLVKNGRCSTCYSCGWSKCDL